MQEEIDLRPYIIALIRQWRMIAIVVAVAVVGAVLVAVLNSPSYTASADVLVLPSRSQLTFDQRFVTNNAVLGTDAASRRQALIALATSSALEEKVYPKLGPDLAGQPYVPGALARRIRVTSDGDLLHIETTAATAQSAQALADTWGQVYVSAVNNLYNRDADMLHELETQSTEAQQRYDQAQHELETYVGTSSIVQVGQQISMTVELLDASREGAQQLYTQYLTQARDLEAVLRDAETLRQQVAAGQTQGLANGLAGLALRARAVGGGQLPVDLRFDNPGALAQESGLTVADLDTLISVLQQRRTALLEQSRQLAQALDGTSGADNGSLPLGLHDAYVKRLSALNQQFEQQTAQVKLLRQRRDLALDSLSILQSKLDEQRVAFGTPEIQVRFLGAAVEPPRSVATRAVLYGSAAAFVGLFFGIVVVAIRAFLKPRLSSKRSQARGERPLDQPTIS